MLDLIYTDANIRCKLFAWVFGAIRGVILAVLYRVVGWLGLSSKG